MRVDTGNGKTQPKRVPLEAETLDQARAELEAKRTENRRGQLHAPGRRPTFEALVTAYLESAEFAGKSRRTQNRERGSLGRWVAEIGGVRCDWIKPGHLTAYRDRRRAQGVKPQTINLDVIALSNALRYAVDRGWLTAAADIPRVKRLKPQPGAKRPLLAPEDIGRLLAACRAGVTQNAVLLRYFLSFLALCGARENEALAVRWADVDFESRLVTTGADGKAKTRHRSVNFSGELEALLTEMHASRQPDSEFLFPSPQRGEQDTPARSLRESFDRVRRAAGMSRVGFHDFRHFFASTCVMGGIDFMTIAYWLGHNDGGVLVGKVYGHLADDHKSRMAAGLRLLKGR